MSRIVIVGASLAGATAAATLRDEGFGGEIVLVGAEPTPPYERPPLSKGYLVGEEPLEEFLVRPPEYYAAQQIETRFGTRAERLDSDGRIVELAGGERVGYDQLLIATGVRNRRFPIPGVDLEGVLELRDLGDADRIRSHARPGAHAVVVGMGFIGSEVAASLRRMGLDVTAIEVAEVPLFRVLGREIGAVLEGIHREHGLRLLLEDRVVAFEGNGRVERVVTEKGRRVDCDFVVMGLGVEPRTELLTGTRVALDNGVLVDELSRTSVEGIFAAGDVANHLHPIFGRVRVEHWQNALKQGAAAARSMLGRGKPYADVHWFWSDQYDVNLQYAGFAANWDQIVIRGSTDALDFIAFYLLEGRILASFGVNRGREVRRSMKLIESRAVIDPALLRNEDADVRELVAS